MTAEDRWSVMAAVAQGGLSVIYNKRYTSPDEVRPVSPEGLGSFDRVSAYLTRRDWIFGRLFIDQLRNSVDGSTYYDLRPRVNFSAISLSYYSRNTKDASQLGFGDVTSYSSWLRMPEMEVVRAPSDTGPTYRRLIKGLSGGGALIKQQRGQVLVMKAALQKFLAGSHRMPHPWLDDLVRLQLSRPSGASRG